MSKTILFVDAVSPKPYDGETIGTEAVGGSEATLIRVAQALAAERYSVHVAHDKRIRARIVNGVTYWPDLAAVKPAVIVVQRYGKILPQLRRMFPHARLILWLHDMAPHLIVKERAMFAELGVTLVTVSDWHRQQVSVMLGEVARHVKIARIYNPVAELESGVESPVDKNKLIYFSSPNKGLDRTLDVFARVSAVEPDMRLYVANPGYYPCDKKLATPPRGVIQLGPLPHAAIIKHVRESLCVFHMNDVFAETFGLVYGECQSVGTPFLTHDLGAVSEISSDQSQLVDVRDSDAVIERVMRWRNGGARPHVRLKPDFRLSAVAASWKALFERSD
jgi:glycosyltransferase involved in cell wall biosynthesis